MSIQMFSVGIEELLLLLTQSAVLGLVPVMLMSQRHRGFLYIWMLGSILCLGILVVFITAEWYFDGVLLQSY